MPDEIDIALGRTAGDSGATSSNAIERILQDYRSGLSIQAATEKARQEGYESGVRTFKSEFSKLEKSIGRAGAIAILRDYDRAIETGLSEAKENRKSIRKRLRVLEHSIEHGTLAAAIIDDEGFRFCQRTVMMGNARLLANEVIDQINDDDKRDLLKSVDRGDATIGARKDDFLELHKSILQSQKFDIRSIAADDIEPNSQFADEMEANGIFELPYPVCWFEWDVQRSLTIGALASKDDSGIVFKSLVRVPGHGWANWDYLPPDAPNRINLLTDHVNQVCRAAIVLLNSKSVERKVVIPPLPLNSRREKRGIAPLFEYTIVEIRGIVIGRDGKPTGQTHRSPRMHWRRGHLRHFRNQDGTVYRVTPIAPMLVGRADLGRIEHDYMLAPQNNAANSR